jgi:hypothetical protein
VLRQHRKVAGVDVDHRRGAERDLHRAGLDAHLTEHRRLLIAGAARQRYRGAEHARRRFAALSARRHDRRQHLRWNADAGEYRSIPSSVEEIVEAGARRVGVIGNVRGATAQLPRQPRVDGAEAQLAGLGALHVVALAQDPFELGRRRERVGEHALAEQLRDALAGARVLPADRRVDGQPGLALPHHRRGALVGQTDRGQILRLQLRGAQCVADDALRRLPDVQRVLLHPPRARIGGVDFLIGGAQHLAVFVEDHGANAGGALADGGNSHRRFTAETRKRENAELVWMTQVVPL